MVEAKNPHPKPIKLKVDPRQHFHCPIQTSEDVSQCLVLITFCCLMLFWLN
jgi:hypothetical protein